MKSVFPLSDTLIHTSCVAPITTGPVGWGGVAAGGGASGVRLQNAKGVVLELRGRTIGLEFNANVSGVQIGLR